MPKAIRSFRTLVFTLCLSVILVAPAASSGPARADAAAASGDAGIANDRADEMRLYIVLASNDLAEDLAAAQKQLARREAKASSDARELAVKAPYLFTYEERRIATSIDRYRNELLPAIASTAKPDVVANQKIAAMIERGGGEVEQSMPLPNSLIARVPRSLIAALNTSPEVRSIAPAGAAPDLMNSPVDGSETWHTNGFIGQGASADGHGGPDFAAVDVGVRTTHLAFRTRLPGDPTNGPATGPTRITSPPGRTDFSGSEHGNTVAAVVAGTDLTQPVWPYFKGLAYGIDKVYDPYQAKSAWYWLTGIRYLGEPGVSDLPEAINYSAGVYEDNVDFNQIWSFIDGFVDAFNTTYSISAGNCGTADPFFTNCYDGPHRVSSPANLYNTISVGGLDYNGDAYNSSVWVPWANSSPGPTWGGRKKPDLINTVAPGGPNDQDDTTYENTGIGTSYAAPAASAGALLLASTGVYKPTAQKAILINSTTPIGGQTYWSPRSGWGALNLDTAFYQRANYADSSVTGAGENGVRFFRVTGVASGDRSTLVWNRRTTSFTGNAYYALTNLDLSQQNQATGATTATGGSDAADTVDTDQTVTTDNPMPGSGTDGGDNVEQVRSTSSGTQILKVKALSAVDGLAAEPFSIASKNPVTALQTPVPNLSLDVTPASAGIGQSATVTATITNSSSDIALSGTQATLFVPAGVSITSGSVTQSFGTLAANGTAVASWQVQGNSAGLKTLTANSQGTAYGETFTDSGSDDLTIDTTPPVVNVSSPGTYSAHSDADFSWSATDASGIASYDVSTSVDGAPATLVLDDTTETSASFTAPEGSSVTVFVSAKDTAGNESSTTSSATKIDAIAPTIAISTPVTGPGSASAVVTAENVGSPVIITAAFSTDPAATLTPLAGSVAYFTHNSTKAQTATLRAQATDALGRSTTAVSSMTVPSKYAAALLKLAKPKSKAGRTTVSGTLNKSATGRVLITAVRVGRKGTKKRSAKAKITSGKFSAKLKLTPGRYRVIVSYAGSGAVAKGTIVHRVTVR